MKKNAFPLTVISVLLFQFAAAQIPKDFKMVNARVDNKGELIVTPSVASSKNDFDFLAGDWTMENRRLKCRLGGCTEWIEYPSTSKNSGPILNGIGDLDIFETSYNTVGNEHYEGLTVRLFDPKTRLWSLYWVDSNTGRLDPPVVGSFEGSVGTFYCWDTFQNKKILVMFKWDKTDPDNPVWSQAFSDDKGVTWEMNMTNVSHRMKAANGRSHDKE